MLRVEASNLMLPPPSDAALPETELRPPQPSFHSLPDRWTVQLELHDAEVAKLYAQGLTRGALVWKNGMPEWLPLLIAPELSSLLRRTRLTLKEAPSPAVAEELTLPRPARLPSSAPFDAAPAAERDVPTIAPTALDLEPRASGRARRAPGSARRRHAEIAAALAVGFAAAWLSHLGLGPAPEVPAPNAASQPAPLPTPARVETATVTPAIAKDAEIPRLAVSDLPLLGAPAVVRATPGPTHSQRAAGSSGAGPSRADLQAALGQVARASAGCGDRDGPVRVVLSFGNSGVARSIQVSGPALPPPIRSCIIGAASRARVPAFTGDPVTVSKTL